MNVIAEIGQNHNGSLDIAKEMVTVAHACGADYVKFAKRDVETCVPKNMWDVPRDTPWGRIPYIEYRKKLEFSVEQYRELADHCDQVGAKWFVSVSDLPSLELMREFGHRMNIIKVPSAKNHDAALIEGVEKFAEKFGCRIMISTGMTSEGGLVAMVQDLFYYAYHRLLIAHCVSCYPTPNDQANLLTIPYLKEKYPSATIGYSGHEQGLQITFAAVALGAKFVERHFTLSHNMWGSDQFASLEPEGLRRVVRDCRIIEDALGKKGKLLMPCEEEPMRRLRG